MKNQKFILASAIFLTLSYRAFAQDCPRELNYYLDQIVSFKSGQDSANLIPLVKCVSSPVWFYVENPDSFWTQDFNSKIYEQTWRDYLSIIRILVPLTKCSNDTLRLETAAALAYFDYPPSEQWLDYYPDGPFKAVLYAILKDTTITGWVEDHYDEALALAPKNPDISLRDRMIYLGLLYHTAQPNAIPFVDRLGRDEASDKLKAAALLVKERIKSIHPEIK